MFADLYQWQDEKGDIHVVDDILLVPPKYKDKVKALKAKPSEQGPSSSQPLIQPPKPSEPPAKQQNELYGDYPLEWWKREFDARKKEIGELEKTIEEEKNFIVDYERGRRLYRLYSKEDIEKYETYKNNLPDNENQRNKLKSDLEEFRRKAQTYGVPREVRE
ncbi:MAG: hypothetical protein AAB197_02995 [Deltaproteobacteria bacterium]